MTSPQHTPTLKMKHFQSSTPTNVAAKPAWRYVLGDEQDEGDEMMQAMELAYETPQHQSPDTKEEIRNITPNSGGVAIGTSASFVVSLQRRSSQRAIKPAPLAIDGGSPTGDMLMSIQGVRSGSPNSANQFRSAIGFSGVTGSAPSTPVLQQSPKSFSPSVNTNSPIHARTTIATRMKQQLSKNNLIRQPSASKLYRYQQMRETIHRAIEEHNLVAAVPVKSENAPPYIKQVNLSMYSDENLLRRERLRTNARIQEQLENWWHHTKKEKQQLTGDEFISRKIYVSLSMAIYYVLMMMDSTSRVVPLKQSSASSQQHVTLMDARKCAEQDWINDAKGASLLNKDEFMDSVFALADLWCESIKVSEYVEFLERLGKRVYDDSTLPLIMRRHVKRAPKSIATSRSPSRKRKRSRKRQPPPPKIDWGAVKRTGIELSSELGSDDDLDSRSMHTPREWDENILGVDEEIDEHDRDRDHQQREVVEKESERRPIKTTVIRKKTPPPSSTPHRTSTPQKTPTRVVKTPKRSRVIRLKSSELRQILQYLRNKEALKLVMALLNQGDEYVLEKTIFDRLLHKLRSGFETNLNSSLFLLMDQNVIPERYQSVMSRLNKLNPEQFVSVLREAMDHKHKSNETDKIVLDMTDVVPSYKQLRPISPPSTKIGATMPRREVQLTKRLLRTVSANPNRQSRNIHENSDLRPDTAPIPRRGAQPTSVSTSARAKWNHWKTMVRAGVEIGREFAAQNEDDVRSMDEGSMPDDMSEDETRTHDTLTNTDGVSVASLRQGSTTIPSQKPTVLKRDNSSDFDPDDDYSMFSELSEASDEMSVWSESTISKVEELQDDQMEQQPTEDINAAPEVHPVPPVRIFRVRNVDAIRSVFNSKPRPKVPESRSSWMLPKKTEMQEALNLPQQNAAPDVDQQSRGRITARSGVDTQHSSVSISPMTDSVVFLNDLSSGANTRRRSSPKSPLVSGRSLKSTHNVHDGGWQSAPASRPTSGIRVQVRKRPQSSKVAMQRRSTTVGGVSLQKSVRGNSDSAVSGQVSVSRRPTSASFSQLSTAEIVYDHRIGPTSAENMVRVPRRP